MWEWCESIKSILCLGKMESGHGVRNCSLVEFMTKRESIRIVVGITCVLSMAGAFLIVLSYMCFKSLRSTVRLILVHLSLMDFCVALANFAGDVADLDSYYVNLSMMSCGDRNPGWHKASRVINGVCVGQAAIALYSTISSVLWTTSLAIYLYLLIVHHRSRIARYSVWFSYLFCYGLPIVVTLWALLTNRLGFSPFNTSGWCGPIMHDPRTGKLDKFFTVMAYDLWIYLTMFFVPVLFLGIRIYLADQVNALYYYTSIIVSL